MSSGIEPARARDRASTMAPEPLSDLLSRCALKDRRAFAELYQLAAPKLFAVAVRICRRRDWAEEILQESFVNVWHHAQGYDPAKSAPMTWMTAVVRNRALDWLRRPREADLGEAQEEMLANLADDNPGPEELLARSTDAARLARCLQALSDDQRRSITLAFLHGLSHAELAGTLRRPLGTIKTWIRRGLEQLRVCLGNV
jgi:RNA polymerase sigma-70 factor, ECF subfamily